MATIKTLHSLGAGSPMADPRLDQLARARAMILGGRLPAPDPTDDVVGRHLAAARERERDTALERALLQQQGFREQRAHDAAQRERDRVARELLEGRRLGQQAQLDAARQRDAAARQLIEDQRYHTGKDRQATLDDLNLGFRSRGEARQIAGDRRKAVEGRAEFFKDDPLKPARGMAESGDESEAAKSAAAVDVLRRQAARYQDPILSQEVDLEGMKIAELVDQARRANRPAGSPEGMGRAAAIWPTLAAHAGGYWGAMKDLVANKRQGDLPALNRREARDLELAQVKGEPSARAEEYYSRGARPNQIPVELIERIRLLEAMAREGDPRATPAAIAEAISQVQRYQDLLDSLMEQGLNPALPRGR